MKDKEYIKVNKMIISKSLNTSNKLHHMIAKHAYLYSVNETETVQEFLVRDDIKRYDLIIIAGNDKLKAVEDIKNKLPKANIILINDQEEIVKEADVIKILNVPFSETEFLDIIEESKFIIEKNPSENTIISCFKSLTFKNNINSEVPIEIKWRTMKAKELFSFLLINSNGFQNKKVIRNMIWDDLSKKTRRSNFIQRFMR